MTDPSSALAQGLSGAYVLERPIGEGGMATVYLAQDLKHQRPVALKVLKPELAQNLGPERFRREITTAARLQHPHILSVHDSGETHGQFWFTMPFVDGESLRDRLRRERCLPVEDALRITREAAQALQYAHERGIVHRDVKPENILLTRDGSTLVADFGIARALGGEDGLTTTAENLTQTGAAIGTPQYMAPEQATGEKGVDARADQYALAAMLYEMLAGEPPFTASTAAALVAKRFTSPVPSVRARRPEVPAAVDEAIQRALALRVDDRFGSMQEFSRAATSLMAMSSADLRVVSGADTRAISAPGITATVVTPAPVPARRVSPLVAGVAVLALLGLGGVLLARRGGAAAPTAPGTPAGGPMRLAVLPFENLGDSASAYFADGMTDEVRGKLAQLPGLAVIARSSSNEYRGTAKPVQEIAKELGATYLLTGTVRWEKASGGANGRVRVSPELLEVGPGGAPTTKWQQTFDAPITDVFQVQGDIATKVASALDVALGTSAQQVLAERPTRNLQAYDAFLRGEAAWGMTSLSEPADMQKAVGAYEQAVALDPDFALAWAQLARVRAAVYYNITPTPAGADGARLAAERAVTLAPGRPESQLALGDYYTNIHEDHTRALTAYRQGLEASPSDAELLSSVALAEWSLGRWEEARRHLEKAQALDPRSVNTLRRLASIALRMRDYPAARSAVDRGLALVPTSLELIELSAMVQAAQGDLEGGRRILREAATRVAPVMLIAYVSYYWDMYWLLDEPAQQLALRSNASAVGDDQGIWSLVLAQLHHLRGETAKAHVHADSARQELIRQLELAPNDAQRHVLLGLAYAYLGDRKQAIEQGERGVASTPIAKDAYTGPYLRHQLARIYLLLGDQEKALDLLEPLLAMPYYLSPGWLRVDPTFDPLRGNPRFEKLAAGS